MRTIDVRLAERSYPIHIEVGLLSRAAAALDKIGASRKFWLLADSKVANTHANAIRQSLEAGGRSVEGTDFTATEESKSTGGLSALHHLMVMAELDRSSTVLAVGGGVVGDIGGFAAATYMRGLPIVHVPTTLLAMVDASIGGKTAINFTYHDKLIKNLIGAFHQPRAVLVDPQTLTTLTARELRCGLAECVKHAMIADGDLLQFIERHETAIASLTMDVLEELIFRSASIKAGIVMEDPLETGRRAVLNLGHTFGHAIEPIAELDLKHGEAVAIGLCAAMHCSVATGRMSQADANHVRDVLNRLQLPTNLKAAISMDRLLAAMNHDKKKVDGRLRLILPSGIGSVEIVENVPVEVIAGAWRAVGAAA